MKQTLLQYSLKKTILIVFFLCMSLCILFIATMAAAQTDTSATTTSAPQVESNQVTGTQTKQEQNMLTQNQQTRIINLCANLSNRFEATLSRLENITSRLEARMQIMNTEGKSVDAAALQLLEVRTTLNTARMQLQNIDNAVVAVAGSEKPQASWISVRTRFFEIYKSVTLAKEQLTTTLRILQNSTTASSQEETKATTTEASSI